MRCVSVRVYVALGSHTITCTCALLPSGLCMLSYAPEPLRRVWCALTVLSLYVCVCPRRESTCVLGSSLAARVYALACPPVAKKARVPDGVMRAPPPDRPWERERGAITVWSLCARVCPRRACMCVLGGFMSVRACALVAEWARVTKGTFNPEARVSPSDRPAWGEGAASVV